MRNTYLYKLLRHLYWFSKNLKVRFKIKRFLTKNCLRKENVLLLMTPIYENLGDQAIAIAELQFFQKYLHKKKILEITNDLITPLVFKVLKKYSAFFSNIVITGGGFLGTIWLRNEEQVRAILRGVNYSNVIIFPQSVYFGDDDFCRKELKKSKEIVSNCKNLTICIRDKSIDFVRKEITDKNVLSIPDIVMFLNYSKEFSNIKRSGVLLCFRDDLEKITDKQDESSLIKKIRNCGKTINFTDTLFGHKILPSKRNYEFENKLKTFKSAELVITDRLHGMLFSLITGTPCIALNNVSKKIEGVWNLWLKDFDYIRFFDSINLINVSSINEMCSLGGQYYNASLFEKYWLRLKEVLERNE